jgi:hypothetical protein
MTLKVKHAQLATVDLEEEDRRELMVFRKRQLKWALESLREALDSHHRSLERLESALIEFEAVLDCQQRWEHPQERSRPKTKEEPENYLSIGRRAGA